VGDDVGKPGERLVLSEDGLFPRVVFAITPERGQRRTGWIGSSDSDAACRADWYKYVDLPPHVQVDVNAARPDRSFSAGDHVAVSVQIKGTAQGLTLTLRADGSEVERFRSSTMEEPMQAVLADVRLIDVKGYDPNLRARVYRDRVLPEVDSGTP
jgi:hypothetical protein